MNCHNWRSDSELTNRAIVTSKYPSNNHLLERFQRSLFGGGNLFQQTQPERTFILDYFAFLNRVHSRTYCAQLLNMSHQHERKPTNHCVERKALASQTFQTNFEITFRNFDCVSNFDFDFDFAKT